MLSPSFVSCLRSRFQAMIRQNILSKCLDTGQPLHKFCRCFLFKFLILLLLCFSSLCNALSILEAASNTPVITKLVKAHKEVKASLSDHKRSERTYKVFSLSISCPLSLAESSVFELFMALLIQAFP